MAQEQSAMQPWNRGRAVVPESRVSALDAYWRCANYLSVGQIYLRANPLLRRPLSFDDVKRRPVGHWGTIPGLNFLFAHLNRLIADHAQPALVVIGPGHGGSAGAVSALVDGTYAERYPHITDDEAGLAEFMRAYSAPHGMPSNCTPMLPGSIHTGGELGYTLSHAFGAAFDNPDQLIVPIVGDGEAEEGAIAAAWSLSGIMNPATDGVVLPIVHLNGYKITTPSLLSAMSDEDREAYFRSLGYDPVTFTVGFDNEDPRSFHARFAALLEDVFDRICQIKQTADADLGGVPTEGRPAAAWPLIIFKSPKGWTTPDAPDGTPFEDTAAIHEVPLRIGSSTERLAWLERWLRSYRPQELFDAAGAIAPEVRSVVPAGPARLGANPIADGGRARTPLALPDPADYALLISGRTRGERKVGLAGMCGSYTREVMRVNPDTFRLFSPDELSSNRMDASLEVTGKQWNAGGAFEDEELDLVPSGKVVEVLSEHACEGMLEGYVLTGRHGIWATYEAFAQVAGSMVAQHCKWLQESRRYACWRAPISSLNILLTSHVWRQDHNGFTHQDPGFADLILNKASSPEHIVHLYYPADANMMLAVMRRAYASTSCVNAIIAGKQESPVYLALAEAEAELGQGAARWDWASSPDVAAGVARPDIVVASCGDVVTVEALAAARMLEDAGVRVSFVNVVDLLRLGDPAADDQALSPRAFEELFPRGVPVLFCFHGYEGQLLRVIARRPGVERFCIHGFRDQGATTTPFGMLYENEMDRFALAADGFALVDAISVGASESSVAVSSEAPADAEAAVSAISVGAGSPCCDHGAQIARARARRDEFMAYTCENGIDHPDLGLM